MSARPGGQAKQTDDVGIAHIMFVAVSQLH